MDVTVFQYQMTILEKHLDTFGHVNNAIYLQMYEEARWDFCTHNGYGMSEIMKNKKGPVLLELNLSFKAELINRETITIESRFSGMKNKYIMLLDQKMIKSDGKVASTLTIEVGLMDLKARRLMEPDKEWLKAVGVRDL